MIVARHSHLTSGVAGFSLLLPSPDVFARHQTYLVRSFVEDSRLMRWCPGQRCNLAVRVFNSALLAVKCRCGHSFCFQCGEDNHAPVDCARLQAWNEKCKNESETAHWIMANTKKCPNPSCGVRIEKNQGCNHMSQKHTATQTATTETHLGCQISHFPCCCRSLLSLCSSLSRL